MAPDLAAQDFQQILKEAMLFELTAKCDTPVWCVKSI